jgi:heme A synthase
MYMATAALLAMMIAAWRAGARLRAPASAAAVAVLLPAQILLGAANVWFGIHAGLIVAHLALGTLLWMATVSVALSTR